jgi:transposase-like protein
LDTTGTYPVVAHCLGGGSVFDNENKQIAMVANILMHQMRSWVKKYSDVHQCTPYLDVSARTGLQMLLSALNKQHPNHSDEISPSITVDLRKRTIELAILDAPENRLLRTQISQLVESHSK